MDGHRGEFTDKALGFYQEAKGLPHGSLPDTSTIQPYTTYVITAADKALIGTMAEKPEELAKQKRLPYVSMAELLGERFHTTPGFLLELNPGVNIETLPAGSVVKVTNVYRPFRWEISRRLTRRRRSRLRLPGMSTWIQRRVCWRCVTAAS